MAAAGGGWASGGDDRLGAARGGGAGCARADPRRAGADRLLLAGAVRLARLHGGGRAARGRSARGRRGPLHLGVGARLQARLPAAAAGDRAAGAAGGDGVHGDRDRGGGDRDLAAARAPRAADDPGGLRPSQPLLRHRPVRGQGVEGAEAGAAAPRARGRGEPAGDRLLRDQARHRGGRPGAPRGRAERRRLPRGDGPRRARLGPAPVHDRRRRGDHRHQRLRDGRRQGECALGLALGDPDERRGLLPGGGARRSRRAAGASGAARGALRPGPAGPLHQDARGRARERLVLRAAPEGGSRQRGAADDREPAEGRGTGPARGRRERRGVRGRARARRAARAPLQRDDQPRPRPGRLHRRARSLLARLPRGRVVQLLGELPAAEAARPLRRRHPRGARGPLLRRLRSGLLAAGPRGAGGEGDEAPGREGALPRPTSRPRTRRCSRRSGPGGGRPRAASPPTPSPTTGRSRGSPPRARGTRTASPRSTASARPS